MKNITKFSLSTLALVALIGTTADAAISIQSVSVVGVNASTSGSTSAAINVNSNSNMNATSNSSNTSSSLNLSIGGDDVRSMTNLDMSIWSSGQVKSDSDLQSYAQTMAHNDTSVTAINSTNDSVTVTFKRPAKFLGFIPTNVSEKATVSVDSNGKSAVSVKKSWWAFLASDDVKASELTSKIESRIAAEGSLSENASLSAEAKAKIISDIQVSASTVYSTSVEGK